jgi:hypothetical protein
LAFFSEARLKALDEFWVGDGVPTDDPAPPVMFRRKLFSVLTCVQHITEVNFCA